MTIAVTGATGFVGSHVVEELVAAGHAVTVLSRSPGRLGWIRRQPARVMYGDLEHPEVLRAFCAGQQVVVHVAGLTRAVTRAEFLRVNVDGSVRVLEAALAASPGLTRFVFLSSQAAMGPSPERSALDEDAPRRPISDYGVSKSLAEDALARYADRVPITVIRPPWVYGPRDRDTLAYFRLAARGIRLLVAPRGLTSIVHAGNLARGIRLAAESTRPGSRAYFLTDGEDLALGRIAELISDAVGRRGVGVRVPVAAVAVAAAAAELAARFTGRPPLVGWRKLGEVRHPNWLVSDCRAREELGYRPAFSTDRGLAETAAWYRFAGWL